jgi:hypothetical protein
MMGFVVLRIRGEKRLNKEYNQCREDVYFYGLVLLIVLAILVCVWLVFVLTPPNNPMVYLGDV